MVVKVGCCGYSYFRPSEYYGKDWKTKYKSVLSAYASKFDLVEVNSTFYKIPQIKTAQKWLEEASEINKNFEFTVKAFQLITHIDKFTKRAFWAYEKMKEICKALNAKVLLFQSPASFGPLDINFKNIRNFFREIDRDDLILSWEPRGKWWEDVSLIKEICRDFDIICCVDPLRNSYPWQKCAYFRLHGFGKPTMYNYKFSKEELKKIKESARKFRTSYVLFNNIYMYEQALEFTKMI